MHEALAGDYQRQEVESVPEQTWSSALFLASFVKGLMGLHVEGACRGLTLAPHLPASWNAVRLRNVRAVSSEVSLILDQSGIELHLQVQNDGDPVKIVFNPGIPLGSKLREHALEITLSPRLSKSSGRIATPDGEFDAPRKCVADGFLSRGSGDDSGSSTVAGWRAQSHHQNYRHSSQGPNLHRGFRICTSGGVQL